MSAGENPEKPDPDVFHCPACGRKHRGDMAVLEKRSAPLAMKCAGCGKPLLVERSGGKTSVRVAEPARGAAKPSVPSKPPAAPAPAAAPSPAAPSDPKPAAAAKAEPPAPKPDAAAPKKKAADAASPAEPAIVAEFPKGTKVGRYVLEDPIGEGGTGTVYRAFDATTNRYVAVKIIGKDQSESMRQRFLREIEVQANLRHPNLMPVFDRGEHEGRPYFAMELLYRPFTLTEVVQMAKGGTLSRYATLRPLESLEKLVEDVILPVCDAMHVANAENGVVHRDLKPDNVLIDSRTLRAYVIDFGICHVLENRIRLSKTVVEPTADEAGIVGTPRFLAPEQARGTVHERTDVWGLGAILHFCATGEPPIAAASPISRRELSRRIDALKDAEKAARNTGDETKAELCAEKLGRLEDDGLRTLDDLFKDAREGTYTPLPATVPAALAEAIRKAMSPKTAERHANARALSADLEAWLAAARGRGPASEGATTAGVASTATRAVRRHLVTGIVGAAALGLGFVLANLLGSGSGPAAGGTGRGEAAMNRLRRFESRVDATGALAKEFSFAEAARRYDALRAEHEDLVAEAATLTGADADAYRAKAAYVLDKFAAPRVRIKVPAEAGEPVGALEDLTRGKRQENVKVGELVVSPGVHRLVLGKTGGVVVPIAVPFVWRDGGRVASREPVLHTIVVPFPPDAVPADWSLVVPGAPTVEHRGPPFEAAPAIPVPVKPFLLERYETTNTAWLAWLDAMPDPDARAKHVPARDFMPSPDRPGRYVVNAEAKDRPVRGVAADAVVRFAAWRSSNEGLTLRLPSEAEWAVAAGVQLRYDLVGGGKGTPDEADLLEPVAVRLVKDSSPCGVKGLYGNVRELVTGVRTRPESPEAFLSKGAGPGDPPAEAMIRRVRPIAADEADPKTGFRFARDIDAAKK